MNTLTKPMGSTADHEPRAHVTARHIRWVVRGTLLVLLTATLLLLWLYPAAAHFAAIPIPVVCLVWVVSYYLERQSRAAQLRSSAQEGVTEDEVRVDAEVAGVAVILEMAAYLAVGTFVLAAILFEWQQVALAAAALFLLALLINLPWIAIASWETARDERDKVTAK